MPELFEGECGGFVGRECGVGAEFAIVDDDVGAGTDSDDGDHGVEHGADHAELSAGEYESGAGAEYGADDDEEWCGDPAGAAEDDEEHESEDSEGGDVEVISIAFDEVEHFLDLDGFTGDEGVESGVLCGDSDLLDGVSAGDAGVGGGEELEDDGGGVFVGSDKESLEDIQHRGAAVFVAERGVEEFVEVASAFAIDTGEAGEFCGEGGDILSGGGCEFVVAGFGVFLEELGFVPCDDDEFVAAEVRSSLLELDDIRVLAWEEGFDGLIELEFL